MNGGRLRLLDNIGQVVVALLVAGGAVLWYLYGRPQAPRIAIQTEEMYIGFGWLKGCTIEWVTFPISDQRRGGHAYRIAAFRVWERL
jgi:hypothetical protein